MVRTPLPAAALWASLEPPGTYRRGRCRGRERWRGHAASVPRSSAGRPVPDHPWRRHAKPSRPRRRPQGPRRLSGQSHWPSTPDDPPPVPDRAPGPMLGCDRPADPPNRRPARPEEPVPEPSASLSAAVADWPNLHVSNHPAVLHKLAILRDERPSPRSSARSSASCRGCWATRRSRTPGVRPVDDPDADGGDAGPASWATGSASSRSCGPASGMVDAMLELMPTAQVWHLGPVPRRADAPAGRVLQQAARLGDRRPVPDPRPDARDRRLGDGRDRGPQEVGRRAGSSWST